MSADYISPPPAASAAHPEGVQRFLLRLRQEQPAGYERLLATPMGLTLLATVFARSRFLSEELLQHPEWLEELVASGSLDRPFTVFDFQLALCPLLDQDVAPAALTLAQFRRRQLLRIFLRDALGRAELAEVCEEISHLAEAILEATLERIQASFTKRYGLPRYELPDGGGGMGECRFCVLALGKLGGTELNYSSDIDLMFLFTANGQTDGPESITNKEFFKKVANAYTELLSTYTAEGLCYRVDLRLRPDGQRGELCLSLDGAQRYYAQRARDWELQMLIKARVAAGDRELGSALLATVEPRIYATTLNFTAIEAMSQTRERMNEKLGRKRKTSAALDIKLAPGGIRDIEFLVQCLQRLHGGREPWVRHGGTLLALSRLCDKELLSPTEYAQLAGAYRFLRTLEHCLQIDEDRQTHTLPTRLEDLEVLARRMPAAHVGNEVSAHALMRELHHHLVTVQELYERVIHAQTPWRREMAAPELPPNIVRHLDQKAPELATALSQSGLRRGRRAFEQLLERLGPFPELLAQLDADTPLARDVFDIFEYSPYLAEEFVRAPELLGQILRARHQLPPSPTYSEWPDKIVDPVELRRLYKREMVRIQSASICCTQSVFRTLGSTSDLADATLAVAYRMAVEQVSATRGPAHPGYMPGDQMLLIALGRLGMREFDLASDADLLFVLPDHDVGELEFWTRVAERVISLLSSYTKEGRIFSIDTRLRPNGRRGPLLQTETSCKKYFATQAEAWEGIAYMKARAVAGNTTRATDFLNELQELDWRRYGQGGRSRQDLRVMRARLEREQGDELALKTGYGGYYDIDFALMYLRLRGGGLFFKVLSTPERIDIVEKMGHVGRTDAEFLRQAATFYRAIDHGLRLYSGHAEGTLPSAAAALESLTELVTRWTGPCPEGLEERLRYVQHATRYLFERLFADETPWSDLP